MSVNLSKFYTEPSDSDRLGAEIKKLTAEEKYQALTYLAFTSAYGRPLSATVRSLKIFTMNEAVRTFLEAAAQLPPSEYLDICARLVSQLKKGRSS